MSVLDRVKARVHAVRERRPLVDHVLRMVEHYGRVDGSALAAAVTYFAFLSFFPLLALAFAVIGWVSQLYPDAQDALIKAIDQVLPDMVTSKPTETDKIQLSDIEEAAPGIASVGLVVVLYSGLGWLSGMRTALLAAFEKTPRERPGFLVGKLRDTLALVTLGVILILSVGVSGVVTSLSRTILEALGLGVGLQPLVWLLAIAIGLAANAVLFFAFFRLLGDPDAPARSLWSGALLGALGFEALKQLSRYLLAATAEQPAFQAFGIALVLVVWINYFSRVIVYAASWAHTSPEARAQRETELAAERAVEGPSIDLRQAAAQTAGERQGRAAAFAAGAAGMLGLVAVLRGKRRR